MSGTGSHGIVVQFLVQGFGSDQDFQRRLAIQELVGRVLEAEGNGESTGGDGGSGTMNAFFSVNDPRKAREPVLKALRDAGELDEGMVVVHEIFREDEEGADDQGAEIWWPADYAFRYSALGPTWKGVPDQADFDGLSEGLPRCRAGGASSATIPLTARHPGLGVRVVLHDCPGSTLVQRRAAVISAARIRIDVPGGVDLRPITGPNRGAVSLGRYELRGGELHFCAVPPDEARPEDIAPKDQHQPGRMILHREP